MHTTERQRECADDHDEQLQHAVIVAGVGAKFNSDEFWRWSGRRRPRRASGALRPSRALAWQLLAEFAFRCNCRTTKNTPI
jgi:hypothetical protein